MRHDHTVTSDEELVEQAQAGDEAAFNLLCDRYLPRVYSRLRAMVPLDAVEDVTQEVFIAALRGLNRFGGRSTFRTWLAAIVRHKAADYFRAQGRQPDTIPLDAGEAMHGAVDKWEDRTVVRLALQRLPPDYQEILLLRFAEGLPFKTIAEELGISLEAAKSRYRRAVAAAAQEMGMTE
ncbi:MAG: RNA polymerase sigma factor [Anaerolineae bacterium]|nr:RNA polymerase sigma factor [Anaerolineae bacterium]